MNLLKVSWQEAEDRASRAIRWKSLFLEIPKSMNPIKLYPVPTGGIPAALLFQRVLETQYGVRTKIVDLPSEADIYVDDIVDSGNTKLKVFREHGEKHFLALVDRSAHDAERPSCWFSFPWDRLKKEDGPHDNIRRILQYIGEDAERAGLKETPDRVVKSYDEIFGGYKIDPASVLKVFAGEKCDEMVVLKDVEFFSTCEHHLQPFFGKAHIAYLPDGDRVVGISKLARLLEVFSRRLQIQERICQQVTSALMEHLKPLGAACVLEAKHFCMTCRGVNKQHSSMITSSLEGAFRDAAARQEFFNLIRG